MAELNRRGFLATIAGGLVIDPERLLWRPGAKLISIPKPPRFLLGVGDTFTIEGRYMVNPQTREVAVWTDPVSGEQYRFLQRFTVTEAITERDRDGLWRLKSAPRIEGVPLHALLRPVGRDNHGVERIRRITDV